MKLRNILLATFLMALPTIGLMAQGPVKIQTSYSYGWFAPAYTRPWLIWVQDAAPESQTMVSAYNTATRQTLRVSPISRAVFYGSSAELDGSFFSDAVATRHYQVDGQHLLYVHSDRYYNDRKMVLYDLAGGTSTDIQADLYFGSMTCYPDSNKRFPYFAFEGLYPSLKGDFIAWRELEITAAPWKYTTKIRLYQISTGTTQDAAVCSDTAYLGNYWLDDTYLYYLQCHTAVNDSLHARQVDSVAVYRKPLAGGSPTLICGLSGPLADFESWLIDGYWSGSGMSGSDGSLIALSVPPAASAGPSAKGKIHYYYLPKDSAHVTELPGTDSLSLTFADLNGSAKILFVDLAGKPYLFDQNLFTYKVLNDLNLGVRPSATMDDASILFIQDSSHVVMRYDLKTGKQERLSDLFNAYYQMNRSFSDYYCWREVLPWPSYEMHLVLQPKDYRPLSDSACRYGSAHASFRLRPGFPFHEQVCFSNYGVDSLSGTGFLVPDKRIRYDQIDPPPSRISADTLFWEVSLAPYYDKLTVNFSGVLDSTLALGTWLHYHAGIFPIACDSTAYAYACDDSSLVNGSFDPNAKSVLAPAFVDAGTRLDYTIQFQNTGMAPAQNITIRDAIDPDIDLATLRLTTGSHYFDWSVDGTTRELVIHFPNIALPDSHSNEPASHGFIKYSCSTAAGFSQSQDVRNTAAIYFDFNSPILTNTTITPYGKQQTATGLQQQAEAGILQLWPNPAHTAFRLSVPGGAGGTLMLTDLAGRSLRQQSVEGTAEVSLEGLAPGLYLVQVQAGSKTWHSRLAVE